MSIWLLRTLNKVGNSTFNPSKTFLSNNFIVSGVANYSRRSDPKYQDKAFKEVKSEIRNDDESEYLGEECGPNWEILAPRENRFYLPSSVGPAWQGSSTTINVEIPLKYLIYFDGENTVANKTLLKCVVRECPCLIKSSLHELFPTPQIACNAKIAIINLSISGNTEEGATKFMLAAREISDRLHSHGYWADFMNPFSGKPFFSWVAIKSLYNVDDRFRGLNMKLISKNQCVVIFSEDGNMMFSGAIYTNAPSDPLQFKSIIRKKSSK